GDIGRFQIAMDDPFRVSRGKSMGDLDPDFHGRVLGKRARREPLTQRLTFEQLGDDVVDAVCLADVVEGEDVGVRERSDGPRFALETGQPVDVVGEVGWQNLDRHLAPEPRIPRAINLAHPARAERGDDLVWPEARARGETHVPVSLGRRTGGSCPPRGGARSGGPEGTCYFGNSRPDPASALLR